MHVLSPNSWAGAGEQKARLKCNWWPVLWLHLRYGIRFQSHLAAGKMYLLIVMSSRWIRHSSDIVPSFKGSLNWVKTSWGTSPLINLKLTNEKPNQRVSVVSPYSQISPCGSDYTRELVIQNRRETRTVRDILSLLGWGPEISCAAAISFMGAHV